MPHYRVRGVDRGDGSKVDLSLEADDEQAARDQLADAVVIESVKPDRAAYQRDIDRRIEAMAAQEQQNAGQTRLAEAMEAVKTRPTAAAYFQARDRHLTYTSWEDFSSLAFQFLGYIGFVGSFVGCLSSLAEYEYTPYGPSLTAITTTLSFMVSLLFIGVGKLIKIRADLQGIRLALLKPTDQGVLSEVGSPAPPPAA